MARAESIQVCVCCCAAARDFRVLQLIRPSRPYFFAEEIAILLGPRLIVDLGGKEWDTEIGGAARRALRPADGVRGGLRRVSNRDRSDMGSRNIWARRGWGGAEIGARVTFS